MRVYAPPPGSNHKTLSSALWIDKDVKDLGYSRHAKSVGILTLGGRNRGGITAKPPALTPHVFPS